MTMKRFGNLANTHTTETNTLPAIVVNNVFYVFFIFLCFFYFTCFILSFLLFFVCFFLNFKFIILTWPNKTIG